MTPEREAIVRKYAGHLPQNPWLAVEYLDEALEALDTERIATQTADAIAHRFERELVAERKKTLTLSAAICDQEFYKQENAELRERNTKLEGQVAELSTALDLAIADTDDAEARLDRERERNVKLEMENTQLLTLTHSLYEHPEDYDGPCECQTCMSYGASDTP